MPRSGSAGAVGLAQMATLLLLNRRPSDGDDAGRFCSGGADSAYLMRILRPNLRFGQFGPDLSGADCSILQHRQCQLKEKKIKSQLHCLRDEACNLIDQLPPTPANSRLLPPLRLSCFRARRSVRRVWNSAALALAGPSPTLPSLLVRALGCLHMHIDVDLAG